MSEEEWKNLPIEEKEKLLQPKPGEDNITWLKRILTEIPNYQFPNGNGYSDKDMSRYKGCFICPDYEKCIDAFCANSPHCNNYATFEQL